MWKRIADSNTSVIDGMTENQKKMAFLHLLQLQLDCELSCLKFDSWESGREEMRINLLAEQSKVSDFLFMKYKIQQPVFEQAISDAKWKNDKEIKDFLVKKEIQLSEARQVHDRQFKLTDEQQRIMKEVAGQVGKVSAKIGKDGEDMGFDDFKIIEKCIAKLEERLGPELTDAQRKKRRKLLGKTDDRSRNEYWTLLKD